MRHMADPDEAGFMPASSVRDVHVYGYRVVQPMALLDAAEYGQLVGHSPLELRKTSKPAKSLSIPFHGPGSSSVNYYPVELASLPVEMQNCCKRLEIFWTSQSQHDEVFMSQLQQLTQQQGGHVFAHVAATSFASRDDKARPTASRPESLSELKARHAELAAQLDQRASEVLRPEA